MRDLGETEVGGFGVSRADDLLFVEELHVLRQTCSATSVVFDDVAVADFFDRQVDRGLKPDQFARIWLHTHPGDCPQPSWIDEETFARAFGRADWAVMFVLAKGGQTYSRLRFNVGPGGSVRTDVEVDFGRPFVGSDHEPWAAEYKENVQVLARPRLFGPASCAKPDPVESQDSMLADETWLDAWHEYLDDSDQPHDFHSNGSPIRHVY